jgi:hypothetical protein
MLKKVARFAHIKVQTEFNIVVYGQNKSIVPKYLTNPTSGKQTNIHISMFDEIYNNYYPKVVIQKS